MAVNARGGGGGGGGWGGGGGTSLYELYGAVPSESVLIRIWSRPRRGIVARLPSSIWQSEIGGICLYLFSRSSVNIIFVSGLDISAIFFSIFNSTPDSTQLAL